MAARGPVGQQFVSVDDYDVMVYPGFLRRPVRRGGAARTSPRRLNERAALPPLRLCSRAPPPFIRTRSRCARGATQPGARATAALRAPRAGAPSVPDPKKRYPAQMARWNDDGSCAPTARVRSGKGEPFCLTLTKQEIDDDLAMFDNEARWSARFSASCVGLTAPRRYSWATSARSERASARRLVLCSISRLYHTHVKRPSHSRRLYARGAERRGAGLPALLISHVIGCSESAHRLVARRKSAARQGRRGPPPHFVAAGAYLPELSIG